MMSISHWLFCGVELLRTYTINVGVSLAVEIKTNSIPIAMIPYYFSFFLTSCITPF